MQELLCYRSHPAYRTRTAPQIVHHCTWIPGAQASRRSAATFSGGCAHSLAGTAVPGSRQAGSYGLVVASGMMAPCWRPRRDSNPQPGRCSSYRALTVELRGRVWFLRQPGDAVFKMFEKFTSNHSRIVRSVQCLLIRKHAHDAARHREHATTDVRRNVCVIINRTETTRRSVWSNEV